MLKGPYEERIEQVSVGSISFRFEGGEKKSNYFLTAGKDKEYCRVMNDIIFKSIIYKKSMEFRVK